MDQVAHLQAGLPAPRRRAARRPAARAPAWSTVRWMLEEFRVSLWDQSRGTARPVSDTRIRKALDAL